MIWAPIVGLVGNIIGRVSDSIEQKRAIAAAEAENKQRLLRDKESNNHEWEMANLTDKDKWLRRISFAMFTWPFVWIYFDPNGATEYFTILDMHLPQWYKQTYMGITGGIWGLSALKNTGPAIVQGVVKAFKGK